MFGDREEFSHCIRWSIGEGRGVKFWQEVWCGDNPSCAQFPAIHALALSPEEPVRAHWVAAMGGGQWVVALRRSRLTEAEATQFTELHRVLAGWTGRIGETRDCPQWLPAPSIGFTVKSSYKWQRRDLVASPMACGNPARIWKPKIPRKIKIFTWLLAHGRLLTKVHRAKWRSDEQAQCGLCGMELETLCHLFCQCRYAQALWQELGVAILGARPQSVGDLWEADKEMRGRAQSGVHAIVASPKRSRRDGKPERERTGSGNLDYAPERIDPKHRRRLQDPTPLEEVSSSAKIEPGTRTDPMTERKNEDPPPDGPALDGAVQDTRPDPAQHDERGGYEHGGRSFNRRAPESKPPPSKKRSFREDKLPTESKPSVAASEPEAAKLTRNERPAYYSNTRDERRAHHQHTVDRYETPAEVRDGRNPRIAGFTPRERFGRGGGGLRGSERFSRRYGERTQFRPSGFQVDKWKHDLYDEANRSPTSKNEEDQIAKVEALLSL
ncbi:hypothetical protein QJS10_CPA05g01222 [Acorus calamus]|uniref:Reverse transcriptase zinc-binding domain-containing protein n=1 Tax=Acorus calamus TaxID=4465 RepID=A0AAV9EXN8_ACOCL|nr:hypothetical protein QJS10_CPA05g01222 [Acorus calamus]